jgi:putative membrane protein
VRPRQPPLREVGSDPDPRFTFANERTFLAWIRTALALVAGGVALAEVVDFHHRWIRLFLGVPLLVFGALVALRAYRQWDLNERAMRLGEPLPHSVVSRALALGVGAVALLTVLAVVLDVATR